MTTDEEKVGFLLNALGESQAVIRAYDTKAQALGALLALVVGLINFGFVKTSEDDLVLKTLLMVTTVAGVVPIVLTGIVLYPHGNPSKKVDPHNVATANTYFVSKPSNRANYNLAAYISQLSQTDRVNELSFELLKTCVIRDRKSTFFKCAMWFSLFSLILVLATIAKATIWA